MEGMWIFMLGLIIAYVIIKCLVLGLVLGLVFGLVLSFGGIPLIYKLRGVPKDKRRISWWLKILLSVPLGIIPGVLIFCGTLLFFTFGSIFLSSPEDVFRNATDLALPQSVTIIDSRNSPGSTVKMWLHFTASPLDISSILASDDYVEQKNFSYDFSSFKPPSWWLPKNLGTGVQYYESEETSGSLILSRKYMFVNIESNEVYFFRFLY